MKTQNLAIEYANKVQAYYPGQDYNTPSIMEFASLIHEPNGKILDIGCGDGQLLRILSERYNDLSLSGLTVSKEESEACSPVFDVRVGDMHQLPWDDASFDIVTARHSLEHSISPLIVLFEINRVLKLGGRAYVVVPAPASDWVIKWADHFSVLPRQMWEKLFVDAGFEIESYCEGTWIASYSMVAEPEYRFSLRKIRDLLNKRIFDDRSDDLFEPSQSITGADIIASKRIVAVLHNLVLFDTIRPLLERFRQEVKIIVPEIEAIDFQEMAKHTVAEITKHGFEVEISKLPAEIRCDIELSPYPYTSLNVSEARWRVRFMYGLAKEAWNFSLHNTIYYDFAMSFGDYDTSILSALTSAYPVGNMKIRPVLPCSKGKRPTLLYLPTYGPISSIEKAFEALMELRIHYKIVSKSHHGTSFLEPERVAMLRELSDEYYDHATPLADLFETADVVLSDGSGAIFDAIAAGVPVAVFQPKVFSGLGGTESLEERLCRERIIPSTNDPAEIGKVIGIALEQGVQYHNDLRNMLFVSLGSDAVDRAGVFLGGLLNKNCSVPPAFLAARENLRKCVERSTVESKARKYAEQQLHDTYQRLTVQLLTDVKRNALAIVERDGQIAKLNQALVEREGQITRLNQAVVEREEQVFSLKNQLHDTWSSISWRITLPIRIFKYLMVLLFIKKNKYHFAKTIYWHMPETLRKWLNPLRQYIISKQLVQNTNQVTNEIINDFNEGSLLWVDEANEAKKVVIIPCAFEFEELYNQRPINAALYYAKKDYFVIYVAWQWNPDEKLKNGCQKVKNGIYQVPLYCFLSGLEKLKMRTDKKSSFLITFPVDYFLKSAKILRLKGFLIIYDIMDDWECFAGVGQAPWYKKQFEHALLLESDLVTAVSPSLARKFGCLRHDIEVIGNGFSPVMLNEDMKFICIQDNNKRYDKVVGYFGHLTDSWFDWKMVLVAARQLKEIKFEIIGYGIPEWVQNIVKNEPNIKLVGKVSPTDLYQYARHWSVAIIPFRAGKLAEAVDPIKVYEYLFFGLPVVVTGINHLERYPLILFAESTEEFIDAIVNAISIDAATYRNQLEVFLDNSTWDKRFNKLERISEKNYLRGLYAN